MAGTELLLFNFQRSETSEACKIFEKEEKQPWEHGGVAQLGEHLPCKQGVMGSIPIISTNLPEGKITSSLFTLHSSLFTRKRRTETKVNKGKQDDRIRA